jgi:hypothetical protein
MSCSHLSHGCLAGAFFLVSLICVVPAAAAENAQQLTLSWADNFLTIHGSLLPGGELRVQYLVCAARRV